MRLAVGGEQRAEPAAGRRGALQRHRHDRHGQPVVAQLEPGLRVVVLDGERRGGRDQERQRHLLAHGLAAAEHDVEDLLEPRRQLGRAERVLHVLAEGGEHVRVVAHEAARLLVVEGVVDGAPVEAHVVERVVEPGRGQPVLARGGPALAAWPRRRRAVAPPSASSVNSPALRGKLQPGRRPCTVNSFVTWASERSTSSGGKRTMRVASSTRAPASARIRRPSAVSQRMPTVSSTFSVRSWTCAFSASERICTRARIAGVRRGDVEASLAALRAPTSRDRMELRSSHRPVRSWGRTSKGSSSSLGQDSPRFSSGLPPSMDDCTEGAATADSRQTSRGGSVRPLRRGLRERSGPPCADAPGAAPRSRARSARRSAAPSLRRSARQWRARRRRRHAETLRQRPRCSGRRGRARARRPRAP